ncbi:MAG: 16S rRNA (guanine(527)-N(7))-methyltransferase RsmG [Clostridiales Family XIII bacterium]|jgi:16S rRNA (guanine527-N7)-methyltransferase|nr:16S rRNA (guanine(527)-N(7))-methyltransferase RsmG [Clostridiales Family XIII bacterium]
MEMTREKKLAASLSALGVTVADEKAQLMLEYMRLTLERNEVINLTAITDEDAFIEKHLMDSLAIYGLPGLARAYSVVDVGAGAGFPGTPLAIACPDKEFLLIDSLRKRTDFIAEACAMLGIGNVRALHARAEDAARTELRESFDLAMSRAVGHLSVLCEYTLPFVRVGGALYAYKSESQTNEIGESLKARLLLGASRDTEIIHVRTVQGYMGRVPGSSTSPSTASTRHIIIAIRKERPTPDTYPRRPGAASKSPL